MIEPNDADGWCPQASPATPKCPTTTPMRAEVVTCLYERVGKISFAIVGAAVPTP